MSTLDIAVCACTYNRPEELRALLRALAAQRFEVLDPALLNIKVVIVDNNPDGAARALVDAAREGFPWPLVYAWEPRPGISHARNKALEIASGHDLMAFLDDDEEPSPTWLDRLLEVQQRHDADIVTGPVFPRYGPDVPRWVVQGRFFEPRDHADGAEVAEAWTNNVLFRPAIAERHGLRFSEALNLSGGEDIMFFTQLHRLGHRIRWARHALVYEDVPPPRATAGWLLRRWYRTGITDALVHAQGCRGGDGRLANAGRGALRMIVGAAMVVAVAPLGALRPHVVMGRCYTLCRGLGIIAHVCNRGTYQPYRR